MPDAVYREYPFLFQSKGIQARPSDDTLDPASYLNLDNIEELAENSFSQRLGTQIINQTPPTHLLPGFPAPLSGPVYSIGKLSGLNGQAWRYAGAGTNLYRRMGITEGPYDIISSSMSGLPWMTIAYKPDLSSVPTMFFADANGMLKDNGTYAFPQQMGIFQPQFPVVAQVQPPDLVNIDNFSGTTADYVFTGIAGGTLQPFVNVTLTSTIIATGINSVWVSDPMQLGQFQYLTVDTGIAQELVLVLSVTAKGFVGFFTKTHALGVPITAQSLEVVVPPSTTASISRTLGTPLAPFPVPLQQADYIGIYVFVSDPTQVVSITLKFDCGDGSFNTDYFYKVIAQGPLQNLLSSNNAPTVAATDATLSTALDLYGNAPGGIGELNTGLDVWTPLLFQLSDFAGSGRADFGDPVFNWKNVNGYQVTIVTNDQVPVTVQIGSLICFGGFGPDTLAGVAYDYRFTFYNANDGTESNPSVPMTNVNPPNDTNWVYPRRQPVQLSLNTATTPSQDLQITHLRIYRRGGTLGDNWRRVDTIPVTIYPPSIVMYTDKSSDADIQAADILSLVNDVPVTSALPNPVNTTLTAPIIFRNQNVVITPASMANISVRQIVTLGDPTDPANDFEEVIVLGLIGTTSFVAYVQNFHAAGEEVQATAFYGLPVTIMALAYDQAWFAGDKNNPHFLYWSTKSNPQAVGSANSIEVGSPDDPITAIVNFKGNLFVSTRKFWWAIAPGTNQNGSPTVYPTAAKHGCVAPFGWTATEEGIYYQAIDGIRFFAGGASTYLTQQIEFLFQGIGTTPIIEAYQPNLNLTQMAYWNNMIFCSYFGTDGQRHSVILHTVYKRWRNDDLDRQCILLEADTNTLVFGDSNGFVRQDRVDSGVDAASNGFVIVPGPIAINLQTPYNFMQLPDIEKQFNEVTLDANLNGQTVTLALLFNDGEITLPLGTATNTQRGKINFNVNAGLGQKAYKVSLQITGNLSQRVYLYQCSIKALPLAKTRQSVDTFQLRLGTEESKMAKQVYWEYTSNADIHFSVYYDDALIPGFTFTLPNSNGRRNPLRQRLPAVSFRMIRLVGTTASVGTPSGDFYIWEASKIEFKPLCYGKAWNVVEFVPN